MIEKILSESCKKNPEGEVDGIRGGKNKVCADFWLDLHGILFIHFLKAFAESGDRGGCRYLRPGHPRQQKKQRGYRVTLSAAFRTKKVTDEASVTEKPISDRQKALQTKAQRKLCFFPFPDVPDFLKNQEIRLRTMFVVTFYERSAQVQNLR
ncbi:MAG: hypothetical protein ACI4V1_02240 [Eubacteriales bacterium]